MMIQGSIRMPREYISDIKAGYISPYDLNPLHMPKVAMVSGINCEINSPLECIGRTPGYDVKYTLPTFSGTRNVAVKNWSVDLPSVRELTTLIRTSDNLLYYSEDFEFSSKWTLTAGGGSLTPNDIAGPSGTTRRGDKFIGGTSTTLEQVFTGTAGQVYTFSLYINVTGADTVIVSIIDDSGSSSSTPTVVSGWQRITVTRTLASSSGTKVRIAVSNSSTSYIWGAQLELASTATGYGYTFDFTKPYYIYLRPYWSGTAWVDEWRELTETRALKTDSSGNTFAAFDSTGNLGESDNYFNGWLAHATDAASSWLITDYTQSSSSFVANSSGSLGNDAFIILSRYNSSFRDLTQVNDCGYPPLLYDNGGMLTISLFALGGVRFPYVIRYQSNAPYPNCTKTVAYNEFRLDYESYVYLLAAPSPSVYASGIVAGVYFQSIGDTGNAGNLIDNKYYNVTLVGVFDDNAKIPLAHTNHLIFNSTGDDNTLNLDIRVNPGASTPRLRSIEVYCSATDVAVHDLLQERLVETLLTTSATWDEEVSGQGFRYLLNITLLDANQPTLFETIQRADTYDNRYSYSVKQYVNGRNYVAGSGDTIVFSNIRDIVPELTSYPHDLTDGYGCIFSESGTAESITGLARTSANDLIIYKDKSTLIYEVQSGRTGAKRLINAFDGIGCASSRGIATSREYGTFWYDKNGVYMLAGDGLKDISQNKIARYWSRFLLPYIPYSFGIFNRKYGEYWIFIQWSGSVGSTTYSDYRVLRYSVRNDNWNIAEFPFVPVGVTETISGELQIIGLDGFYKFGYDETTGTSYTTAMVSPTITIQCPEVDTLFDSKTLIEAGAQYTVATNFTLKALVNDETTARSGNARVFRSTKSYESRLLRHSSNCDHFKIQMDFGTGDFNVRAVAIDFIGRRKKYVNLP
jgi:hypothetical protein